ncbi:galactose mutarotase [Flavobacteriaceae bacterium KMM 6898]|nr:galactose mutarotase [Flavobacteriaceae bacterium KMM 6898]
MLKFKPRVRHKLLEVGENHYLYPYSNILPLKQITIKNEYISLTVLEYGAIIQKMLVKDKDGNEVNVVIGHEQPEAYFNDEHSLGACIGRYAGRISQGGFRLDGEFYPIHNENEVHLHGGIAGFGKKHWTIIEEHTGGNSFLKLSYESEHLEEGYPGNLIASVTYKLVDNALHILHEAQTDKTTVVNLTNHAYFKLDGEESIDHYNLELKSEGFLDVDRKMVPTGDIIAVGNTPNDFLKGKKIGQVRLDTPFIFSPNCENAAKVSSDVSGIVMTVTTNQPSIVIYTPTSFPAICFETQNFPDAPNHSNFPSSILRQGEIYRNESTFAFGTLK